MTNFKYSSILIAFLFLSMQALCQTYTVGSHKDEVLRIQGTPTSINTYNASGYEVFNYGYSSVNISLRTSKVTE